MEETGGAYAVYAEEPPLGFDIVDVGDVEDGWEDRWRDFHHGVRVGRLWIGPPWEAEPGDDAIVIDPGRAFGTGAHPTTRLTLELLQTVEPASLLDVGCGSGVLSIAAAKLGFAPVSAIDLDEAAVEATAANAQVNGVEVAAFRADGLADELPESDVALGNVALDVVEALLPRLPARCALVSGYLERDRPTASGWKHIARRSADGWAADLFERQVS